MCVRVCTDSQIMRTEDILTFPGNCSEELTADLAGQSEADQLWQANLVLHKMTGRPVTTRFGPLRDDSDPDRREAPCGAPLVGQMG